MDLVIIIIISPLQSSAGYRRRQFLAISLDLQLLASASSRRSSEMAIKAWILWVIIIQTEMHSKKFYNYWSQFQPNLNQDSSVKLTYSFTRNH
jgi:hypothetical protein